MGSRRSDLASVNRPLDKYCADLEESFHSGYLALVGDEKNYVNIFKDDRVVMRNDDLLTPDNRGNRSAGGKFDVLDGPAHDPRTPLVTERHGFDSFSGAPAQ